MKVLLVDIGNTRVKWARWENGRLGRQHAAAHESWTARDFEQVVFGVGRGPEKGPAKGQRRRGVPGARAAATTARVVAVSVAGSRVEKEFATAARRALGLKPQFIRSKRQLGGVTTKYKEPWRLGADRLVAAIGGHHFVPGRAVCIADIGTAMTLELVDAQGVHRGGAIVPGPRLMIDSLLTDTSGIKRRAGNQTMGRSFFARDTRAAIEQGARYTIAAVIDRALVEAREALGEGPVVLLTGGASAEVSRLVRARHHLVPDLVLRGLVPLL